MRNERLLFIDITQIYSLNSVVMFIMMLIMCANIIKNIEVTIIREHKLRKKVIFSFGIAILA